MSLTNPKKVVTEERLSEFYNQILPYLGGMPDMLANKFDKSIMYSTDEKIVGQWINGKPLYQITISGISPATSGSTVSTGLTNIDYCFIKEGIIENSLTYVANDTYVNSDANGAINHAVSLLVKKDGSEIYFAYNRNGTIYFAGRQYYITLCYTKTTDSAISIGNDTDYSTDEKIVGTWIDGRPIWQKTINFGALRNTTTKNVAHEISNFDKPINIWGYGYKSDSRIPLPYTDPTNLANCLGVNCDATNVWVISKANRSNYTESYITIQYIKTA